MAAFLEPLRLVFGTRITFTWIAPETLQADWDDRLKAVSRENGFLLIESRAQDGKIVVQLRDLGQRTPHVAVRVRDFSVQASETLKVNPTERKRTTLSVQSPATMLKSLVVTALVITLCVAVVVLLWQGALWWNETRSIARTTAYFGPLTAIGFGFLISFLSDRESNIRRSFDRAQEELAQRRRIANLPTSLDDDDGAGASDVARENLQLRTRSIRDDRDQLWNRAQGAYRLACVFLLLSLGGPITAVWLVTQKQDWHFLLASLTLAAVPLAIGLALLRHDNKMREQHRDAETELAVLDRLQLALDYAQADSKETQRETLRKVITRLLRPAEPLSQELAKQKKKKREKAPADAEESLNAGTVIEKATEIVTNVLPKGS